MTSTLLQQAAQCMGEAVAQREEFDFFMLLGVPICPQCQKSYKRWGWLRRHMRKMGHRL